MSRFCLLCCLALFTLLPAEAARAARIYRLVDYPALQNGHTLTGTITTTDDAPLDSVLQANEILDWEWSIAGANNLSVTGSIADQLEGIAITATSIEFPLFTDGVLRLRERSLTGNQPLPTLHWIHSFDDTSGMLLPRYAAGISTDVFSEFWSSKLTSSATSNWVIATAVPEPSAGLLGLACLIALFATCRGHLVAVPRIDARLPGTPSVFVFRGQSYSRQHGNNGLTIVSPEHLFTGIESHVPQIPS